MSMNASPSFDPLCSALGRLPAPVLRLLAVVFCVVVWIWIASLIG